MTDTGVSLAARMSRLAINAHQTILSRTVSPWEIHAQASMRRRNNEKVIMLSMGEPDWGPPEGVAEEIQTAISGGKVGYSPAQGELVLREAVAKKRNVTPEHVLISSGAQNGLFTILSMILDKGNEVITTDPAYVAYPRTIEAFDSKVIKIPMTPPIKEKGWQLPLDQVENAVSPQTKAILLNSPHNPSGAVLSKEALHEIAKICERKDLFLICDEVYREIVFDGLEFPSVRQVVSEDDTISLSRVITIESVSKSHAMPGWRVGWIIAEPSLIKIMSYLTQPMLFGLSPFTQESAARALAMEANSCRIMQERLNILYPNLEKHLSVHEDIPLSRPMGGMFVFLDIRQLPATSMQFCRRMLDQFDVSLLDGKAFGSAGDGFVRVGMTGTPEELEEAAKRMSQCISEFKSEHQAQRLSAPASSSAVAKDVELLICFPTKNPRFHAMLKDLVTQVEARTSNFKCHLFFDIDEITDTIAQKIDMAAIWNVPKNLYERCTNLKLVLCMGAGVEYVFKSGECIVPENIRIGRVVDKVARKRMAQYMLCSVLNFFNQTEEFTLAQRNREWNATVRCIDGEEKVIGIMGVGEMGQASAEALSNAGLNVIGWRLGSRAPAARGYPGFTKVYEGKQSFHEFLSQTHVLVCLLPLTDDTRRILSKENLEFLPKGAYVINAARGGHANQEDIIELLDSGHLERVTLDVFEPEPLDKSSPLWSHPKVRITPHVAADANISAIADRIIEDWDRFQNGLDPLLNVSRTRGY